MLSIIYIYFSVFFLNVMFKATKLQ